jgi:hypothetical protein
MARGAAEGAYKATGSPAAAALPPPTITSGPTGTISQTSARFEFSHSEEPKVTFSCKLDADGFATCESPTEYPVLSEGTHTFQVRAMDADGNPGEPATRDWTVDTVAPPRPTITSGPTTPTSQRSARFTFTGEPGVRFFCRRDDRDFERCSSPETYSDLSDGAHTFRVRAEDEAGNSSAPRVHGWTVDTVAPGTVITSAPAAVSSSASATFNFGSTEDPSTFLCSLNGAAFAPCTSPHTYGGLANGVHAFRVRATDAAGNTDATPASHSWTVNVEAPPTPPTVDRTPTGIVRKVTKVVRYRLLRLRWQRPADEDFDHVVVLVGKNPRRPPTPVYRGTGTSYTNSKFQNGSYYRYAITSYDRAGNASRRVSVVVRANALLSSPRVGARVRRPPLLDWASVPKATYYNVQLWVGSKKVLTAWPSRSSFKLRRVWPYRDAINRLKKGKYQWYVWPAFGPRSQARYGKFLGQSSFVVTR